MTIDKERVIENITKLSLEQQNQQLRLFAKVDLATKLKILEYQKQLFHKLKNIQGDAHNAMLTLVSLIIAVENITKELDIVKINAVKLRGKNARQKAKRQKLLGLWSVVRTLKLEQNMSFRQIAEYLKKYHKFEVAHSTVYELWVELETKNFEQNGEKENG